MAPGASSDLAARRLRQPDPGDGTPGASADEAAAGERDDWPWDGSHPGVPDAAAGVPRWVDDIPRRRGDGLAAPDDLEESDRRRPRRRDRLVTAPPAAIALVVIGVLACVVTIVTVVSGSSDEVPTAVAFPSTAGPTSSARPSSTGGSDPAPSLASTTSRASNELVVSVVGLVRTPGLVRLPPTARIADAIARAGGGRPGADLLGLNLAQPLRDGDQVIVGYADPAGGPALRSAVVAGGDGGGQRSDPAGAQGDPSSGRPPAGAKVDLNTADAAALDALPGVGPKTAAAILAWRDRNGRFASVEQLAEVDGIGPARFATLRDLVTV